jgi:hypothetical protein
VCVCVCVCVWQVWPTKSDLGAALYEGAIGKGHVHNAKTH